MCSYRRLALKDNLTWSALDSFDKVDKMWCEFHWWKIFVEHTLYVLHLKWLWELWWHCFCETSLIDKKSYWDYFLPNQGIRVWRVYRKRSKSLCEYIRQESPQWMLPSEIRIGIQMFLSVKLNLAGEWIIFWMCKLCRFMQILYILTLHTPFT